MQVEQGMLFWRQGLGRVPVTSSPSPCRSSEHGLCVCAGEGRRKRRSLPSFHNKPLCDVIDWIIGDLRGRFRSNRGQLMSGGLFACVDECCCPAGLSNVLQEREFVDRNK